MVSNVHEAAIALIVAFVEAHARVLLSASLSTDSGVVVYWDFTSRRWTVAFLSVGRRIAWPE